MSPRTDRNHLRTLHRKRLSRLLRDAPFVLRITRWAGVNGPVLVVKERRQDENCNADNHPANREDGPQRKRKRRTLVERGHISGEAQRRCLATIRTIVAKVLDRAGIPLDLQRYLTPVGLRERWTVPLDDEAGAKLGLIFRLHDRVADMDRVELMARRVERFSREEAGYWYSRLTSFGREANRWAASGMRIMLGGQPSDPAVGDMLIRLRARGRG